MNDLLIVALVMPVVGFVILAIFGFGLIRYLNRHDYHSHHRAR